MKRWADVQAQHLLDTMIPKLAKDVGATEQLKMTVQLRWEGIMNAMKGGHCMKTMITLFHFDVSDFFRAQLKKSNCV